MGTVDYISPEQGRGKDVDGRSDLYSMGVLMYQMLSGRLPFEADSPTAMIFQHVYEQPKPLASILPDVSPLLTGVIEKLMEKSPDDRYQKAEQVLADLQALRAGKPLPSGIDGSVPRSVEPSGRVESFSQRGTRPQTIMFPAPRFEDPPLLPDNLDEAAPTIWWQRARRQKLSLSKSLDVIFPNHAGAGSRSPTAREFVASPQVIGHLCVIPATTEIHSELTVGRFSTWVKTPVFVSSKLIRNDREKD